MTPTRPRTKAFVANVIKTVAAANQERDDGDKEDPVEAISFRAPGEFYVERQQCSDDQERSCSEQTMRGKHPRLGARRTEVIFAPREIVQPGPERAARKHDGKNAVEDDLMPAA